MLNSLRIASISAGIAVVAGAFGAHALKEILSEQSLHTFETAVRYQFYHSLAVIVAVLLHMLRPEKFFKLASNFFLIGILLFSCSLYFLSFKDLLKWDFIRLLGPVTPLGGLSFILGWVCMAIAAGRVKNV